MSTAFVKLDTKAPELQITWNSTTKLPVMTGIDNVSSTTIVTQGGTAYPDRHPPEAVISFDPVLKDLIVRGVDAGGVKTVTQATTSMRVVDNGGNTLIIPFVKYKEKPDNHHDKTNRL